MSPTVISMCMKRVFLLLFFLVQLASCDRFGDGKSDYGAISVCFVEGSEVLTRAYDSLPDTCDFKLTIADASGRNVYDGLYGDCPEVLELPSGSYVVSIRSSDFSRPAFDSPQFGDEQCVTVSAGQCVRVALECSQMNSGVRLDISDEFKSSYDDAALLLKASKGSLLYSFNEKRIAYFSPGTVSVVMSRGAKDEVLMVKGLEPCNMYTIRITAPSVSSGISGCGLEVVVDTARVWNHTEFVVGETTSAGEGYEDAITVADARNVVGQEGVWVAGYIVGGDLTSASASFEPPFKSATNLLLGPRSVVIDRATCISVQLPDNEVREALNLVDHQQLLGKRVALKGDVVGAYFGLCGLKNTVDFVLY